MLGLSGDSRSRATAALVVAVLVLAGCGDDDDDATAPPGVTVTEPGNGETTTTGDTGGDGATTTSVAETTTTTEADGPTPVTDPSGPDLQLFTLPECSVVPGGALSGADNLTMFVAVRNGGPGQVDRLVPISISSNTGLAATSNTAISTGSATSPMSVDLSAGDYGTTHVFTIVADPDNEIIERDVTNNEIQVTVNLPGRPAQATDVPCTSP